LSVGPKKIDEADVVASRAFDLEACAHVGYIGIRMGLGSVEVFDWIAGWIWFDPMEDDIQAK
jgi:hypothetical protein